QQYKHSFGFDWRPDREVRHVVSVGMGGSGLAALAAKSWPGIKVPFEIVQDYDLPGSVSENTLIICSSYSGNAEETVSVLEQAIEGSQKTGEKPMIVVIASGGVLAERAREL